MRIKRYRHINAIETEIEETGTGTETEETETEETEEHAHNALVERINALAEQSNAILEAVTSIAESMSAFVEAGAVVNENDGEPETEPDEEIADGITAEDADADIEDMDFNITEEKD